MSTPIPNTTMADILECAADMVFDRGLHKGGYAPVDSPKDGPRCTAGYIRVATMEVTRTDESVYGNAWFGVAKRFRELVNITPLFRTDNGLINPIYSIARWNDADERTAEDVREAFLLAAKDLRNESRT